jgi:hypothetical protein
MKDLNALALEIENFAMKLPDIVDIRQMQSGKILTNTIDQRTLVGKGDRYQTFTPYIKTSRIRKKERRLDCRQ